MSQNIFITHTPFHVFIAEIIVKNIFCSSKYKNIILPELNRNYKNINNDLWSKIEFLENVGCSTVGRERFLMSEKNIEVIKQYTNKDVETHLFISDIAWPMNNRIFFDKHLRSRVKYCLFSDGLGTYSLPKVTRTLFLRGLAKSINGLLHRGVRYNNYIGNQFGLDREKIKYIYAPNVKLVDCNVSKKKEVPFNSAHGEGNFSKEKCLFLDQPFWRNIQADKWNSIREVSVNYIRSLGIKELFYKNHHFGRKEDEIYYKSQGFNIVNSNKCAEQIVTEEGFGTVISYLGSALFNLKCMYNSNLHCVSLFSNTISLATGFNDNKSEKIIDLFRDVNVEIIEIL